MRIVVSALVAVALLVAVTGTAGAVSQAGGIALTFPVGAKYNSLGEAGTAESTDYTAMWWNPGGFAYAADTGSDHGLHLMYTKLVPGLADDVYLMYLGYGQRLEGWGMLGFNITYLDQGEQEGRDAQGNETDNFSSYQFSVGATYGVKFSEKLGLGMGLKYFRDELAPDKVTQDQQAGSGDSWAVDLGGHYRPWSRLKLGLAVTNLGPKITFVDEAQADPMPRTIRAGISARAYESAIQSVNIIVDYLDSWVDDDETHVWGYGAEWGYSGYLFLRFGYKDDPEGDIQAITGGVGLDLSNFTDQKIVFDYGNVPQAEGLERVHRISLTFEF